MKEEDKRQEYVELDTGLIWRGSYNRMRPCIWNYAQFEKDILDCTLYLMTKIGRVPLSSCGDPVQVTRALSAAVSIVFCHSLKDPIDPSGLESILRNISTENSHI